MSSEDTFPTDSPAGWAGKYVVGGWEPTLFVEGQTDIAYLDVTFAPNHISMVDAARIDFVDADGRRHAKKCLAAVAQELVSAGVPESEFLVLVDRDFDAVQPDHVLVTDRRDFEAYLMDDEALAQIAKAYAIGVREDDGTYRLADRDLCQEITTMLGDCLPTMTGVRLWCARNREQLEYDELAASRAIKKGAKKSDVIVELDALLRKLSGGRLTTLPGGLPPTNPPDWSGKDGVMLLQRRLTGSVDGFDSRFARRLFQLVQLGRLIASNAALATLDEWIRSHECPAA